MKKELQTEFSTRQYMLSNDFEIYYYNDVSVKSVDKHSHDYYEFYFFLEGNVNINIEGTAYKMQPNDVVIIPPHTKHNPEILDDTLCYRRFVFWISQEYCNKLLEKSSDYGYLMQHVAINKKYIYHFDIFKFNEVSSKIINLIEELHANRFGKNSKVSLLTDDLIFTLNRIVYEMDNPNICLEETSLYENILNYIEGHIDEELTLDTLAQEFFVSKYHIAHVFKANIGLSIHQYIIKKRLELCRDAIINNTEITTAYLKCGFKDYSAFFKAFKKEYGISPREYKELHQQT